MAILGGKMTDKNRAERLQLLLSPEELAALDDWRFANRMPSRAAAIRELLKRGLNAPALSSDQKRRSRDYGVLDRRANGANGNGSGRSSTRSD
jgi:hypothetical protein